MSAARVVRAKDISASPEIGYVIGEGEGSCAVAWESGGITVEPANELMDWPWWVA